MLFGLVGAICHGCSCTVSPTGTPACESAWQYQAVFTGVVTGISHSGSLTIESDADPPEPMKLPKTQVRIWITRSLAGLTSLTGEAIIETGRSLPKDACTWIADDSSDSRAAWHRGFRSQGLARQRLVAGAPLQ